MEVSAIILFSLLMCGVKATDSDDSLAALATRVRLLEGGIHTWELTAVNTEIKLMNKFDVLESSLKEKLTGRFLSPLIMPLVKLAISDIMKGDYISNIISGQVPGDDQSLSVQNTKIQLRALAHQLRRAERERDTYRKSLRKQRRRMTKDIRAFQLELNQSVAELGDARMLKSELNQTNNDLCDTKRKVTDLTEDLKVLNTSCVMMRNEVESCMDGLQGIRLNLLQSLTAQLNQTREDLLDTKGVMNRLTEDVVTLNVSCGIRKEIRPSDGNGNSLVTSSLSQLSHTTLTTTFPGTTAATPSPATDHDLSSASEDGDLERVKRILAAGHVGVNSRRGWFNSRTPVMRAAGNGHSDVVEFLVGRGADLSLRTRGGDNALHLACYGGHLETVTLILSLNVMDINSKGQYSRTPVMKAAENGHRDVVEFLVGRGADVSLVDRDGDNVLHLACRSGDVETVKLILSLNAMDVNSRGRYSMTPVMAAARSGHKDVVEFLVGRGADLSLVDKDGSNILHLASRGGDVETVKLILSLKVVDINARNNKGQTAVYCARYHYRVLYLLVSRGAQ
ncbi:ankyrin repeat domain-containing protein 50-like [Haliotis asinina]|uniref:ankyrin repeat domain-containing protein 50-like n=1 Tax=Haliotis asinina TaxID=109174 RepID=UPI003531AC58